MILHKCIIPKLCLKDFLSTKPFTHASKTMSKNRLSSIVLSETTGSYTMKKLVLSKSSRRVILFQKIPSTPSEKNPSRICKVCANQWKCENGIRGQKEIPYYSQIRNVLLVD